jgi:UDPglucose 6-dehydrogenase
VLRELHAALPPEQARVGILGLAYKENTASTKNSASLALIGHLDGWPLQAFDPVVSATAVPNVTAAETALDAARGVDALAIMTPWPQFGDLDPVALAAAMRGRLVLDPFGVLPARGARAAGLDHRVLGMRQERAPC